ncbi:cytochrome ubiquinol oxidase subunit I [Sulfuricystis thermophila]|uniref:cytochrome ubiquinol oxidase subunit I n=1 Tax=Sulfuricystis thermophila TaxID=2496847 RepID=UPI001035BB18|nr:cytochrome ubiquinol oxidase subunit I [Sulfuricystis thermophila]
MIDPTAVDLARLQFAATAMYHFLFVPLTLGLSWLLVIMESAYVLSGKEIWRDMTKFWGKLYGINFALGVSTGLTMEFQFGTNWAYYSHYVGDIFGAPLAIEGLAAFFLESTMVGLFFFGWQRLSKVGHLMVTMLMALGTNLSAVLILIANGWMQEPVGAAFNPVTMRMELNDFWAIVFNPAAQAKFVHTVSAGYVTGAVFVLAISSWYLLKGRHIEFAKRSFRVAAAFGLAGAASVIVLGDESGYAVSEAQKSKLAALEAMWETEPAPAGFNVIAGIDEEKQTNSWAIRIPYVLGLLATRSTSETIPGIREIREHNKARIESGIQALVALEALRKNPQDGVMREQFQRHQADLGYGLLLKKYTEDMGQVTPEMIAQAAHDSVPKVAPLFWTFRFMVLAALLMLALFVTAIWHAAKGTFTDKPWLLKWALYTLPLPWLAAHAGWFVAEYGRQPWTVHGLLPTHLSASTLTSANLWGSLAGFLGFYTLLLIAELYLMIKYAKLGPYASLGKPETVSVSAATA